MFAYVGWELIRGCFPCLRFRKKNRASCEQFYAEASWSTGLWLKKLDAIYLMLQHDFRCSSKNGFLTKGARLAVVFPLLLFWCAVCIPLLTLELFLPDWINSVCSCLTLVIPDGWFLWGNTFWNWTDVLAPFSHSNANFGVSSKFSTALISCHCTSRSRNRPKNSSSKVSRSWYRCHLHNDACAESCKKKDEKLWVSSINIVSNSLIRSTV